AERVAQHHVGRLPAEAGQCDQVLEPPRDLAVVSLHQRGAPPLDTAGLVAVEAGRPDEPLQLLAVRARVVRRRPIPREQGRRHLVDPLVRALGGQDGRHAQLEGVAEVEFAPDPGERPLACAQHAPGPAGAPEVGVHSPRGRPSPAAPGGSGSRVWHGVHITAPAEPEDGAAPYGSMCTSRRRRVYSWVCRDSSLFSSPSSSPVSRCSWTGSSQRSSPSRSRSTPEAPVTPPRSPRVDSTMSRATRYSGTGHTHALAWTRVVHARTEGHQP